MIGHVLLRRGDTFGRVIADTGPKRDIRIERISTVEQQNKVSIISLAIMISYL